MLCNYLVNTDNNVVTLTIEMTHLYVIKLYLVIKLLQ